MTLKLSPTASRGAALAILAGIAAVLYFGIAAPLLNEYGAMRDSIGQLQDRVQRYQHVARDLAPRRAELAALKRRQSAQDGFLQGANDTLIAVQIQNRLKALADQTRSELRSTQVLPAQDEGKLRRISIRGQISTTVPGALRIFYGLESADPLLFIDNVDMRARPQSYRNRNEESHAGVIDMQFDVYGYTRGSK
jgi:general secretion pathway protein M